MTSVIGWITTTSMPLQKVNTRNVHHFVYLALYLCTITNNTQICSKQYKTITKTDNHSSVNYHPKLATDLQTYYSNQKYVIISDVSFSYSLLAFVGICLVSFSEWCPFTHRLLLFWWIEILVTDQLTGFESAGITYHNTLHTGRIQILVLTNCPGNWYWNWYWLIKNIRKLLFFHLNIFPSTFYSNFWYSINF